MAIRSFGSRATRRFAKGERCRLPPELAAKVDRVLQFLADGSSPADLREVVLRFQDGDPYDVQVLDYRRS